MTSSAPKIGLFLLGAGGHGRVVADIAEATNWTDTAFLDDRWPAFSQNLAWPILGTFRDLAARARAGGAVLVTIGGNHTRLNLHRELRENYFIPTLIHPSAVVSPHATIGAGCVVMANAVINAGARIGDAVIVNTAATIDHDCRLADGVHISPGAHLAGGVDVGEASWVGIGSAVREGVVIGADVVVGAGAAVIADIQDGRMAAGVPATVRKAKSSC
ncbi:acetyltransferase [Mesorhizobium sp. ES1-1]|uniref:acetyltransferase n=1 Tax=Mesorhizobium sp. ES1-1 TaxID=2876629 RepID=UPI001CCD014D|nr:acetyltransferase [Mesorhizobium sp. ES1-1]MBZ9674732.1 acetyltransferase [Mesorhizobium sp. ES1-1]